ncbi:MAG: Ig-like domain-containing protein [Thermoanaerobaculia bacterium]
MTLLGTRVTRRRHFVNARPIVSTPRIITARATSTNRPVQFTATDPDNDPITFYAELGDSLTTNLDQLASSLVDHGDGTASFTIAPRSDQSGYYRLHVAAFDEEGAFTQSEITLIVEDSHHPTGDTNCDGSVNTDDIPSMVALLFDESIQPPCVVSGDINGDGSLSISDILAIFHPSS